MIYRKQLKNILLNAAISDFEVGLEYCAAIENKCKCIITEDQDDFYFSEIAYIGRNNNNTTTLSGRKEISVFLRLSNIL